MLLKEMKTVYSSNKVSVPITPVSYKAVLPITLLGGEIFHQNCN